MFKLKDKYMALVICLMPFLLNAQTPTGPLPDTNWGAPKWEDNFRTMNFDSNKSYIGKWNISNNSSHGVEPEIFMKDNLSVDAIDGITINVKKEDLTCVNCAYTNYHYSSGNMMRWVEADSPQYGYMEATVKMSNTYGIWPAFWTWVEQKKAHFVGNSGKYYRYNASDLTNDPPNTTTIINPSLTFNGVFFTDKLNGYAVGTQIYHTTDNGNNWTAQTSGSLTFKAVNFTDFNNGIAAGSGGTIYRTTNAGTNWVSIPNPSLSSVTLNSISFPGAKNGLNDDNTGYIVGSGGTILKTVNAGQT